MASDGTKRALVIKHVAHEGLAGLRAPVEAAGYRIDAVHMATATPGIDLDAADLVVVMGGPMGAYEKQAHPWIGDEIAALARRIDAGRPTLGICLGAQLIAAALGSAVYPGPVKEIGFAPLSLSPAGASSPVRHLAEIPVLHWHGDTFDLPDGAELLASSARYANQAFRIGPNLLGVQCHPEMGVAPGLSEWLVGSDDYIAEGGTDAVLLLDDYARFGPAAVQAGRAMLTEWIAQLRI